MKSVILRRLSLNAERIHNAPPSPSTLISGGRKTLHEALSSWSQAWVCEFEPASATQLQKHLIPTEVCTSSDTFCEILFLHHQTKSLPRSSRCTVVITCRQTAGDAVQPSMRWHQAGRPRREPEQYLRVMQVRLEKEDGMIILCICVLPNCFNINVIYRFTHSWCPRCCPTEDHGVRNLWQPERGCSH